MLSKAKISQIRSGFQKVYNIKTISDDDIIKYGTEIITCARKFPFEEKDEDLFLMRLTEIQDLGDNDKIQEYISRVPHNVFSGKFYTRYEKLFEIGRLNKIGYLGNSNSEPELEPEFKNEELEELEEEKVVSTGETKDEEGNFNNEMEKQTNSVVEPTLNSEAVTIDKNNNILEEEKRMSNAIEQLQQEAGMVGVGTNVITDPNLGVDANSRAAARELVENESKERMNYSEKATINKVLTVGIKREEKAVQGRATMGKVSNAAKALEKFKTITGFDEVNGAISFKYLHASQTQDDAMKVYNELLSAIADPNHLVKPFYGREDMDAPITIKGIVIDTPDKKEIQLSQKDIASHILQNCMLLLKVGGTSGAQFQIDAAKPKKGAQPKKSYVVRIANKANLLDDTTVCIPVKLVNREVMADSRTPFKSELAVAVYSQNAASQAGGEKKKITWRIPLDVEQFKVDIVQDYSELFANAGVGRSTPSISLEDAANVEKAMETLANITAAEISKGKESILNTDMIAKFEENKKGIMTAESEEVNKALGGKKDENDFE
jgi:hypothetical protein